MKTYEREISVTIGQLRKATLEISESLRTNEYLHSLSYEQTMLAHAYMLGAMVKLAGIAPGSMDTVLKFVRLGYAHCDGPKGEDDEATAGE
jgi:hypothetical protein